jgi:general secretion pathway protein C
VQVSGDNILMDLSQRGEQVLRSLFDSPRNSARLALWVNLVLITLIAYAAATMSWQLVSSFTHQEQTVTVSRSATKPQTRTSLSTVPQLHVFGEADKEPIAIDQPIEAPETRLRLELTGLFASSDPKQSLAIISEKNGKDESYRIGDSVPGNATLHEVYADRVILKRLGNLETLRLKEPAEKIEIGRSATPASSDRGDAIQRTSPKLKDMQEMYKTDPQSLFQQLRITPVTEDGRITGYRFSHNDPEFMQEIGLTRQDIITAVNGVSVSDSGKLFGMMKDADQLGELNLTVLRDGQSQDLFIRIE